MLNGSYLGQRGYVARNPSWTVHKPMMGFRANNQRKGKYGIGEQKYVREAFAIAASQYAYGARKKVLMNGVMTPTSAFRVQQNIKKEMGRFPQIALTEQAKDAKIERKRQQAHASTLQRWGQGSTNMYMPQNELEVPNLPGYY
jgi:hypothetical protein